MAVPQTVVRIALLLDSVGRVEEAELRYKEAVTLVRDLKGVGHPLTAGQ